MVEVPHAGLSATAEELNSLVAPAGALARDADLYVDELYADAPSVGATLMYSQVSRYVCDLNRAPQDVDALAVVGGRAPAAPHGLVWRSTTDGAPALHRPLSAPELEERLTAIYRPYHDALGRLLERKRARFGFAILLCGHSMPSRGRADALGRAPERADVVPGSRGGTSAHQHVIDLAEREAKQRGYSVAHDDPYRGGFSTAHYGRPDVGVHALQIELARRLYMDERTLARKPNDFAATRDFCRAVVERLEALRLA
ncbi:MAG: N-formylglutamate amidohydrolase [Myxococcales bacterium]|nr:N-formylglutamate amidohydrolase [Myxococcales bacterium]